MFNNVILVFQSYIIAGIANLKISSKANDWRNMDRLYIRVVGCLFWLLLGWLVGRNAVGLGMFKWSNLSLGMGEESNIGL